MKQKYSQVKAKGNANGVQIGNIVKKQKNERAVVQVMESVAKNSKPSKVVAKNNKNQNTPKKTLPPKKGLPPKKVIKVVKEEEELEEEENSDSGADVEADADEPASDLEEESDNDDMAEVEDEEQESDDAEEEDDEGDAEYSAEEEDDEDASSDDEAPVEKPITKQSKADKPAKPAKQIGIPKIKCSDIPIDFPNDQVVLVKKLPKKGGFKQIDLVEVFAKYGTLHTVKPSYNKDTFSIANIAYTTAEAAKAALAADKTEIKGAVIRVLPRPLNNKIKHAQEKKQQLEQEAEKKKQFVENADRSLFIKNLKTGTKEPALREHFASCGEIEHVKIVGRKNFNKVFNYAFITFADSDSAQAALKLNNSVLNNATIGVYMSGDERTKVGGKDPKRTVILKNLQHFESFPADKIEAIFGKCGKIDNIDIACMKNVLAFISFKNEDSVPKALALNETTHDDLQIEVVKYQLVQKEPNTSVFMTNVKPGTTESEIREFFAETGAISNVFLKMGFAIVKFANTDGFCKAFLQNEKRLSGQQVFLEPYSEQKKRNKRPYPFNKKDGGNKFKKPNFNKV